MALQRAKVLGVDLPDVKVSLDSLGIMEEAMRYSYLKSMIEKSAGELADWKAVDNAMIQAASIARDVGRYADRVVAFRIMGPAEAVGRVRSEGPSLGCPPPALAHGRPAPAASGADAPAGDRARLTMTWLTAGCCLRLPRPPVRLQRGRPWGDPVIGLTHGRPSPGRAAFPQSSRKVHRSLPARGCVYCAGGLSGNLADAGG